MGVLHVSIIQRLGGPSVSLGKKYEAFNAGDSWLSTGQEKEMSFPTINLCGSVIVLPGPSFQVRHETKAILPQKCSSTVGCRITPTTTHT